MTKKGHQTLLKNSFKNSCQSFHKIIDMNPSVYKEILDYMVALSRGEFEDFDIKCCYVKHVRPLKIKYTVMDTYSTSQDYFSITSTKDFKVYVQTELSRLYSRTHFQFKVSIENGFISFMFKLSRFQE